MADIPRFSPSDLGVQNFTHNPGSVASAVERSFYSAQENSRQNAESVRADERLAMQQVEQGVRMEETAYQQTLRPIREQALQLGVAQQGLQLANQNLGLQSAQNQLKMQQLDVAQQEQMNSFLNENQTWMGQQSSPRQGGVPTTSYSYGAAVGGPDEMQDKWTNRGYSATGKNLTEGVVAVNTSRYPLGTVFRDQDSGEVFIAADKHGNKNAEVVDFFRDPTNYQAQSGNRNLQVIGREQNVPNTSEGVRNVLSRYRQTDGTGVPSLSQVTSAKTPTGVPLVAAAANSLNPGAVIAQSFAPEQQQALNRYDSLAALARTAPQEGQRFRAMQQMSLMDNDPRFQEAKAQREEMIKSTQAQIQVQGMLQSAPDDMVRGFQARYGSKFRFQNVDGRAVPVNQQGQPLNSQDYGAFSRAFTDYATNYKFDPVAATAEARAYEAALPRIAELNALRQTPPPTLDQFLNIGGTHITPKEGKVYEQQLKLYQTAVANYEKGQQQVRQLSTELALQSGRNPMLAQTLATLFPAQQAAQATQPGEAPAASGRPSIQQLARGQAAAPTDQEIADDDVWTDLKNTLNQNLQLEGFEDTGTVSPDNAALRLAARIQSGEKEAIDEAAATFGGRNSDTLGTIGGDSFFSRQSIQPRQVARAWAEDVLIKYGYLDPQTKRPVAGNAAAPSRIKSITPVN